MLILVSKAIDERCNRRRKNSIVGSRRNRQHQAVMREKERSVSKDESKFAGLEDLSILVLENRQENLVFKIRFNRVPFNVEV